MITKEDFEGIKFRSCGDDCAERAHTMIEQLLSERDEVLALKEAYRDLAKKYLTPQVTATPSWIEKEVDTEATKLLKKAGEQGEQRLMEAKRGKE